MRVLLFLLWFSLVSSLQAEPVRVSASLSTLDLAGYVSASPKGDVPANAEAALARFRAGVFQPLRSGLSRGYDAAPVWLAFDLRAEGPLPEFVVLDVGPAMLDEVEVFQTTPAGIARIGRAGDQVPHAELTLLTREPAFVLPLRDNAASTVLVRIQTTSTQAAFLRLHRPQEFQAVVTTESMLLGGLFALNALMVVIALILYLMVREGFYLSWLAYASVTSLLWFFIDGFPYRYFTWMPLPVNNQAIGMLNFLSLSAASAYVAVAFDFRALSNWLYRVFMVWAAAVALFAITGALGLPFAPALSGIAVLMSVPLIVAAPVAIVMQISRRHRDAMLHGPLYLLYFAASCWNMAAVGGFTEYSRALCYGWQVAGGLNFLSLQVAAVQRARRIARRAEALAGTLREVKMAESHQRAMLSMASHEFRTPAATIKASLDSLAYFTEALPDEVRKRLDTISRAAGRLTTLATNLISTDRLQELAIRPQKAYVEMRTLVSEVAGAYPEETPVACDLPDQEVHMVADSALLKIALHNMIDNALWHTPPGNDPVRVGLRGDAGRIELWVTDTGPRLPEVEQARLFDRFVSAKDGGASGVGLWIVRTIAKSHGGDAFAHNPAPTGTTLVMTFAAA